MRLKDKVILITASTRGIGLAITKACAEEGAIVYMGARNLERAGQRADELNQKGFRVKYVYNDAYEPETYDSMVEEVVKSEGRIDVLVNNAGITADKLLLRMTEADFDNVLATNLKGAFFCTKAACRFMMHQRYGRIISVSSVVGLHGNAGQANYAASKAGLIGLTKSTAKEYAARNITANAVAPGFIATDMTAVLAEPVSYTHLTLPTIA